VVGKVDPSKKKLMKHPLIYYVASTREVISMYVCVYNFLIPMVISVVDVGSRFADEVIEVQRD
jgi:hypothetical protein